MSRNRASIEGGYVRKTISIPTALYGKILVSLKPGQTMSAFMTEAGELHIDHLAHAVVHVAQAPNTKKKR